MEVQKTGEAVSLIEGAVELGESHLNFNLDPNFGQIGLFPLKDYLSSSQSSCKD